MENQCAVAAAACLRVVSQLNRAVIHAHATRNRQMFSDVLSPGTDNTNNMPELVDEFVYCMAAEPSMVVLYVAWKDKTSIDVTPSGMPCLTHEGPQRPATWLASTNLFYLYPVSSTECRQ